MLFRSGSVCAFLGSYILRGMREESFHKKESRNFHLVALEVCSILKVGFRCGVHKTETTHRVSSIMSTDPAINQRSKTRHRSESQKYKRSRNKRIVRKQILRKHSISFCPFVY